MGTVFGQHQHQAQSPAFIPMVLLSTDFIECVSDLAVNVQDRVQSFSHGTAKEEHTVMIAEFFECLFCVCERERKKSDRDDLVKGCLNYFIELYLFVLNNGAAIVL